MTAAAAILTASDLDNYINSLREKQKKESELSLAQNILQRLGMFKYIQSLRLTLMKRRHQKLSEID